MMRLFKKYFNIPTKFVMPIILFGGIIAGLGAYIFYMSKAHAYLSDNPSACVNCHIMTPYYQTWFHNSHSKWTTCNDCHVPQNNVFSKYYFKAKDGLLHSTVFTFRREPLAIRARHESSNVIMNNCIRCHTQLNTEFVKTGMISFSEARNGMGKACWDCHAQVAHGKQSSIASTPNAFSTPLPKSPIPDWLKKAMSY